MSDAPANEGMPDRAETRPSGPIEYPTNNVLAVLDTSTQVASTVEALTGGGFLASEIQVTAGTAAADALGASTGHRGLRSLAVRIAERIGYENAEMKVKQLAEQALRDGHFVLLVAAPGDERKDAAVRILRDNDAHSVTYLGRFTVEKIVPPRAD